MPVPFSHIPQHIQMEIVQKQYVRDFAMFSQTSRECHEISLQCRTTFVLNVSQEALLGYSNKRKYYVAFYDFSNNGDRLHTLFENSLTNAAVRVVFNTIFVYYPSEEAIYWLTHFIESTNSVIHCLHIDSLSHCLPEQLNTLLEAAKVSSLQVKYSYYFTFNLPRIPALKNLKVFLVEGRSLADEDFLGLTAGTIYAGRVSTSALNIFLKEWQIGKRVINRVNVSVYRGTSMDVLKGLNYGPPVRRPFHEEYFLWDEQNHTISILFMMKSNRLEIKRL